MARSFNGSSDKIDVGAKSVLAIVGTVSVSAWFKLSAFVSNTLYVIAEQGYNGTHTGYTIGFNNGALTSSNRLNFVSYSGGAAAYGCHTSRVWSSADVGVWHHVCGVWDGALWHLYIDGVEDTIADNPQSAPASSSGSHFTIGCEDQNGSFSRFFNGTIAEVGVTTAAITANEAVALAKGVPFFRVRPGSLVGYWPLWGLQSPEPDLSGNGNNGTLTGTSQANHAPVTLFTRKARTQPLPPVTSGTSIFLLRC